MALANRLEIETSHSVRPGAGGPGTSGGPIGSSIVVLAQIVEGEHHDAGSAQIFIKAAGEHTGGSFFLAESTLTPGFAGPPPHRHRELPDMFYVLEATLTLRFGGQEIEAGPGSFACVPPGVVHTFCNDSDGPVRLLNFNTPAGWENYMRDVAKAAQSKPLTPEVMARVPSRYDFEFVQ